MVTYKLWKVLNLENHKILKQVQEINKNLYTMLKDYQDVFKNENCHVGKNVISPPPPLRKSLFTTE